MLVLARSSSLASGGVHVTYLQPAYHLFRTRQAASLAHNHDRIACYAKQVCMLEVTASRAHSVEPSGESATPLGDTGRPLINILGSPPGGRTYTCGARRLHACALIAHRLAQQQAAAIRPVFVCMRCTWMHAEEDAPAGVTSGQTASSMRTCQASHVVWQLGSWQPGIVAIYGVVSEDQGAISECNHVIHAGVPASKPASGSQCHRVVLSSPSAADSCTWGQLVALSTMHW